MEQEISKLDADVKEAVMATLAKESEVEVTQTETPFRVHKVGDHTFHSFKTKEEAEAFANTLRQIEKERVQRQNNAELRYIELRRRLHIAYIEVMEEMVRKASQFTRYKQPELSEAMKGVRQLMKEKLDSITKQVDEIYGKW